MSIVYDKPSDKVKGDKNKHLTRSLPLNFDERTNQVLVSFVTSQRDDFPNSVSNSFRADRVKHREGWTSFISEKLTDTKDTSEILVLLYSM